MFSKRKTRSSARMSPYYQPSEDNNILNPLVHLWMLRILVPMGGYRHWLSDRGLENDTIAERIGMNHWIDLGFSDFNQKAAVKELRKIYKRHIDKPVEAQTPDYLRRNIERLTGLLGLSEVEAGVLEFAVLISSEQVLDDAADYLGSSLSSNKIYRLLARILDIPESDIRTALGGNGVLRQSGLISIDYGRTLGSALDLISQNFADNMTSSDADPVDLLGGCVIPSTPAVLSLDDYPHVDKELAVLRPLMETAVKERRKGVNIFIFGAPGTGKTQLAKALAHSLHCELFDVANEDEDGDPISGMHRLRAYRSAQHLCNKGSVMLLFDEMEDVFSGQDSFIDSFAQGGPRGRKSGVVQFHKAWFNRMLEQNQVPTLWLSNSRTGIDPAYIRRFQMIFELPVPPLKKRQQIIQHECGDILQPTHINRLAELPQLAPAVVTQTASAVRCLGDDVNREQAADAFDLIAGKILETQGHKIPPKHDPNRLPETYDPAAINADSDPAEVAQGLIKARSGRLCLYGPPGTGKTAYARWLARRMDSPLLVKRGSDLISMWLGETEQNIAAAFAEAERENAVLLIDEVDSFLQDRRGARHSWEITQVNEMLTQMEGYSGVFIASTNLIDGLDQASLRRFDVKMKFDYLRPDQAWSLFSRHCGALGLSLPKSDELKREIKLLPNLAPGDFAAVVRRNRFQPVSSLTDLLHRLRQECGLKESDGQRIGFV